jgi:hypothetical protein
MSSDKKLPPLPDDAFDGVKQKTEVKFERCTHKNISFVNGELRCPCGVAYAGPNLHELYTLLHKG